MKPSETSSGKKDFSMIIINDRFILIDYSGFN
jgi:hypothetical protein